MLSYMQTFLKIHPNDKVAVALKPLSAGDVLTVGGSKIKIGRASCRERV